MSGNDMNKALMDMLGKMDKKALQENMSKALDVLKNSNTEELAKQINSIYKNQQGANAAGIDKAALEKLNIDPEALNKLGSADLEKMLKYLGSHGDEIKGKLKDVIK